MARPSVELTNILLKNSLLKKVLDIAPILELPNWYLAAGSISQTYWNHAHNYDAMNGIKDFDLVYYDTNLSYGTEDNFIKRGKQLFRNLPIEVEIRNQARVHVWYPKHFGRSILPYTSVEDGISSWATTITCMGLTKQNSNYFFYSTFGTKDLFDLRIRPNKKQVTSSEYKKKCDKWLATWPKLTAEPW